VNAVNGTMGELLGQLYVDKHFDESAKARMDELIANLVEAYRQSITGLEWMSEETKQQALLKLSKFDPKVGYPKKWRDYSALEVTAGDLVANVKSAATFEYNRQVDKLDKPVDKSEWFMNPQTVNAYYNPVWNEIVFPAAILQPPFFNVEADDAVNYGGIGSVIGHEIGHGFDDQGRQFDGDGNLRDWWTDADAERFNERKDKLAAQYDGYEVIDGLTINGQFTSGENIGDLGGLGIAYKAYRLSLGGEEAPVIDGYTGDQRFFLGWAQVWRSKARDEEAKRLLTIDPHSPPKFRANGAAVNIDPFYEAFDVKEGDGMYLPPEERVKIW
jgi:predicted metalloendopeptidase